MGKIVYGKESGTVYRENILNKLTSYASQREDLPGNGTQENLYRGRFVYGIESGTVYRKNDSKTT